MITRYHYKYGNVFKSKSRKETPKYKSNLILSKNDIRILFDISTCKCSDFAFCECSKEKSSRTATIIF